MLTCGDLELPERRDAVCPPWIHINRNKGERLWAKLKERNAVTARHETLDTSLWESRALQLYAIG